MSNKDKMIALLGRAYSEGAESRSAEIADLNKQHAAEVEQAYQQGVTDTINSIGVKPSDEDEQEGDGIPVHSIENPIVSEYFAHLPEGGYKQSDISRMWYYTRWVKESSGNQCERGNPYVVYCDGDSLLLECEGEKPQTILPNTHRFECYVLMPNKVYSWKVSKSGKVVKSGKFKTIGDVRFVGFDKWTNVRDMGGYGIRHGLLYSAANPDEVVAGSADHELIKYLGIVTQVNLRTPKEGSVMEKSWREDIFDNGYNINIEAYTAALTKNVTRYKTVIDTLVKELEAGHKVVFNCWAGADRTGTLRYILQGICGVPKEKAQGYYELTSFSRWLNTKMWDKEESSGGELRTLDKNLESLYGSDFYTQCYRFLKEKAKVTETNINKLKSLLKA